MEKVSGSRYMCIGNGGIKTVGKPKTAEFLLLPLEILTMILKYLDHHDLRTCRKVCQKLFLEVPRILEQKLVKYEQVFNSVRRADTCTTKALEYLKVKGDIIYGDLNLVALPENDSTILDYFRDFQENLHTLTVLPMPKDDSIVTIEFKKSILKKGVRIWYAPMAEDKFFKIGSLADEINLKELNYFHDPTAVHDWSFCYFLGSQSQTLEKITLKIPSGHHPLRGFAKLETIILENITSEIGPITLQPIYDHAFYPCLNRIYLRGNIRLDSDGLLFRSESVFIRQLATLELPRCLSAKQLASFAHVFPNVQELILGFQVESSIRLAWNFWRNVKSIYLCVNIKCIASVQYENKISLDELFTGFTSLQIAQAKEQPKKKVVPKHRSLKDLESLETLIIEGLEYSRRDFDDPITARPNAATDISGCSVFMGMKSLKKLNICNPQFTHSMIATLQKAIPEFIVKTRITY